MYAVCAAELTAFIYKAITAICMLSETLVITVNDSSLILSAADAHEAGVLFFSIPQRKFERFCTNEKFTLVYKSSRFKAIFRNTSVVNRQEWLQLHIKGTSLELMWVPRRFGANSLTYTTKSDDLTPTSKRICLLRSDATDISVLRSIPLVYRTWSKITMPSSELVLIINEMAVYGTHIRIQLDSNGFTISTSNELGVYRLYIDKAHMKGHRFAVIKHLADSKPIDSTYIMKYLLPVLSYGNSTTKLDMFLSDGQPLIICEHIGTESNESKGTPLPSHLLCTSPIINSPL